MLVIANSFLDFPLHGVLFDVSSMTALVYKLTSIGYALYKLIPGIITL